MSSPEKESAKASGQAPPAIKVVFDKNTQEPGFESEKYGSKQIETRMTALNAIFLTENPIDRNILQSLYVQSFTDWSKQGDYSLRGSLSHMRTFASLL